MIEKEQDQPAALPATGYVRQAQLVPHIIPFSAATLWRKVKAGTFPAPVKLSAGVTAWKVKERARLDGRARLLILWLSDQHLIQEGT